MMTIKTYAALSTALLLSACATDPYTGSSKLSNTAIGATAGALIGAGGGALVGATTNAKTRKAALIGAGIGALAGGGVGLYMDNQEKKLRERLQNSGVSVTREGDNIVLNMPSNITFAIDQDAIKPNFYETLNSVSLVLNEFNKTLVDVNGFTDSDGSENYNMDLSRRRAESVAEYLGSQGVNRDRLAVQGFGEARPIATNATAAGKQQNRRVEIIIQPLT